MTTRTTTRTLTPSRAVVRRQSSDLQKLVVEHAIRGAALHVQLRALLVTFVLGTVLWVPPEHYAGICLALSVSYAVFAAAVAWWFRVRPATLVQLTWLVLTIDLLMFGAVNELAGVSDRMSWTPYILVNGFVLVPILAAAQLRLRIVTTTGIAATALYLASSISARAVDPSDIEPWSSVVLRTFVVAGISTAAVLLTRLQLGRVADIGRLAGERAELLDQLGQLESRERRELAEALHDGALQYLLGARLELEEARSSGGADSFDRVDEALRVSAQLLRSTVAELHPAVLAQAGLTRALRDLAAATRSRTGLAVTFVVDPPEEEGRRDSTDLLIYSAVREFVGNAVKHAEASRIRIEMTRLPARIRVTVTDDGRGIADGELERQLAAGHIGLASQRVRVEAAGGKLTIQPGRPRGTVVTLEVPSVDG